MTSWARGRWPLALFLPHLASVACTEPPTYEPYDVLVGGTTGRVATGGTASISVSVQSHARDEDFDVGYCGRPPESIEVAIDRVACAPDCTATASSDKSVTVTSSSAGEKVVEVFTRTSDGKAQRNVAHVTFADVTKILVTRDVSTSPSGTTRAMVLGDSQSWKVSVGDDLGPLAADVCAGFRATATGAISVTPSACSPTESASQLDLKIAAARAGAGSIELRHGALTRSAQVVVVDPAHTKSATLLETGKSDSAAIDTDAEPPAPSSPLIFRFRCESDTWKSLVPRLVMDDGTVALGGARLLHASIPAALATRPSGAQSADFEVVVPSDGSIGGTFGAAQIDARYIVRTGCSQVDEVPEAGAPDASGDAADDGGAQ